MHRWALKIGYIGWNYSGFQRQPNKRTIEDIIIKVLQEEGVFKNTAEARYNFASRTDKGVSSIGQVISFDSNVNKIILPKINKNLPEDIWIFGYKKVEFSFNPRKDAQEKHYRYLVTYKGDISTLRTSASLFEGVHNFRYLSKKDKKRVRDPIRAIRKIEVKKIYPELVAIDFFGKSFLWEQIRRTVRVILMRANEEITDNEINDLLKGMKEIPISPMPGEGLILMDIKYKFTFNYDKNMLKIISKRFAEMAYKFYTYYGIIKTVKEKVEEFEKTQL